MKMKYNKALILLLITLAIGFVIMTWFLLWNDKLVPDALISSWFSFIGIELGAMAGIKISEVKSENKKGGDGE